MTDEDGVTQRWIDGRLVAYYGSDNLLRKIEVQAAAWAEAVGIGGRAT